MKIKGTCVLVWVDVWGKFKWMSGESGQFV